MPEQPFVSIIIPCRNEEKFIGNCLDSVIANDYPKEKLEVFVVDGLSKDKTRAIIEGYSQKYPYIKLLENPRKYTPFALNLGIKKAKGEIIMRMDAHATYENNYISKCLKYLEEYRADNVGGIWKIVPRENTVLGKAIAFVYAHPFGTGNSRYKLATTKKIQWVDTVPFGCYRKEIFTKIGLFNENLIRSQDMEFNLRLRKNGGKILLVPEVTSYYYVRSNLKDFFLHNLKDGVWAIYPLKFVKVLFPFRHYIPLFFIAGLLALGVGSVFSPILRIFFLIFLLLYLFMISFFSLKISLTEKDFRFFPAAFLAFLGRHFGYGFGSLWGVVKLII